MQHYDTPVFTKTQALIWEYVQERHAVICGSMTAQDIRLWSHINHVPVYTKWHSCPFGEHNSVAYKDHKENLLK